MDRWLRSDNVWLIRSAILHQNCWKADTDQTWLFGACRLSCAHNDFFVRKAIGWALRSYAFVEPDAVRAFVSECGDSLSGLSRREALKHLGVES